MHKYLLYQTFGSIKSVNTQLLIIVMSSEHIYSWENMCFETEYGVFQGIVSSILFDLKLCIYIYIYLIRIVI